jgi:ABC-type sugar transport system ATPase subunit
MSTIILDRVSAGYDGTVVIKDLTLRIPSGRVLGLLGPSGCGKTTILRMIAGLLDPLEGDITFDDVSILKVPTEQRHIGMVFQQHVLFPHMSVEENVAFGLRMQGQSLREARPRVQEVLSLVQLHGLEKRFPRQQIFSCWQTTEVTAATPIIATISRVTLAELMAKGEPGPLAAEFSMYRFREGKFIDESVAAGVAH